MQSSGSARLRRLVPAIAVVCCFSTPVAAQVRDVVVNEIAWMGSTADANGEWIELRNNTGAAIDLGGFTLSAADGTPGIALTGTIPAGGYYLLERGDGAVPGLTADQTYTGALENVGEDLSLLDATATLQDRVDQWHAGNNTTKATMQRVDPAVSGTDAGNWTNGPVDGTPLNSGGGSTTCSEPLHTVDCQLPPPFAFRAGGPVVINELMINPFAVADNAGEYVELYNSGTAAVDIEGWTLRDDGGDAFVIDTGGPLLLAPADTFVVAANANPATNGGFTPDLVWTGFFLSNAGDEVVLVDGLAAEQDRLVYTGPPFTDSVGRSLERVSPRLPTSSALSWVEGRAGLPAGDLGSPGAVNTLEARRYVLRGTLVTMDETLPAASRVFAGAVHVQGNRILDVLAAADPLPPDAASATVLETGGLIFPGLMNIHDHILFNTIPAWDVPSLMQDVSDWTSLDAYQTNVRYPHRLLTEADFYALTAEVCKYTEAKALAAGTTSIQGSFPTSAAFTDHLVRNVDLTNFGADRVRQRSLSVLDASFQSTEAPALVADMDAGEVDVWLTHSTEGTAEDAALEFQVLKDVCLVRSETAIIHATALTPADLDDVAAAGAKIVLAPTSNYLYYGATADVPGAVSRGITVSLSTDWAPAGDKNLLASMKSLALIDDTVWADALTDEQIVTMVTLAPAKTLNWCDRLGALRAGYFADIAVVLGDPSQPYASLVGATEEDVVLTVIDGDPLYGRPSFLEALKPGDYEVVTSACGFEAGIDVTDPVVPQGLQPFSDIVTLLADASVFDFDHMRANFQDPTVAAMTDPEFQAYLDASFPLGILPKPLDPLWVVDDADYFAGLQNETNVTALDPTATLDIEPAWDLDADGLLNSCEPALWRGTLPTGIGPHLENLGPAPVDDLPGTLSNGADYYYLLVERGAPPATITLGKHDVDDTVRVFFTP
jgi:cytosine/adenosine deaminase-related metal-dependent hydrolase